MRAFVKYRDDFRRTSVILCNTPFSSAADFHPNTEFNPTTVHRRDFKLRACDPCRSESLVSVDMFSDKSLRLYFKDDRVTLSSVRGETRRVLGSSGFPLLLKKRRLIALTTMHTMTTGCPSLRIVRFSTRTSLESSCLKTELDRTYILQEYRSLLKSKHVRRFYVQDKRQRRFEFTTRRASFRPLSFSKLRRAMGRLGRGGMPVCFAVSLSYLSPTMFPKAKAPRTKKMAFLRLLRTVHAITRTGMMKTSIGRLTPVLSTDNISATATYGILHRLLLTVTGWANGLWRDGCGCAAIRRGDCVSEGKRRL